MRKHKRRKCSICLIFSCFQEKMCPGQGILKIWSKFPGEHPCWSVISIKLQSNFIEIILRHGCFPGNLLHIFRTPFRGNTSWRLLLNFKTRNEQIISKRRSNLYKFRESIQRGIYNPVKHLWYFFKKTVNG